MGWDHLTAKDRRVLLHTIEHGGTRPRLRHAEIHTTDRCQARCFFCSTDDWRGADPKDMPMSMFLRLVAELRGLGCRSVRLAGGGEPLHHPSIEEMLARLHENGIAIENLTTNGIQLEPVLSRILVTNGCDRLTVALNTGSDRSYAAMMGVEAEVFHRVLANTAALMETKRSAASARPVVCIQFLVHKGNFHEIPVMYRLGRDLAVDKIVFDGLAYLEPHERMDAEETSRMLALYRDVIEIDGLHQVARICSHEQPIEDRLRSAKVAIGTWRSLRRKLGRLEKLVTRRDIGLRGKILALWCALCKEVDPPDLTYERPCFVGFHSTTVRATGAIAMCCAIQDRIMGHLDQGLANVWYGASYESLRRQLRRIIREGRSWTFRPDLEGHVVPMCAQTGFGACRTRDFFYQEDMPFVRNLNSAMSRMRGRRESRCS